MREPPVDLSNHTLHVSLRILYDLDVADVTFLPVGQESSASVYRVRTTDGAFYGFKVRKSRADGPGLLVPRFLRDQGITHVIAPLGTARRTASTEMDGYWRILKPFVAGNTGTNQGMAPSQ